MLVPDKAITHAGKFHADDVFSAAFLKLLNPDIKIERVSKVPEVFSGLVFDIGLGKYDHHQIKNEYRKNGIPYASFGKLWRDFAPMVFSPHVVKTIDKELVQPIDAADNGKGYNLLSVFISKLNPNWNEEEYSYNNENFTIAVSIAFSILKYKINLEKRKEEKLEKQAKPIEDINEAVNSIFVQPFMNTVIHIQDNKYEKEIKTKILYEANKKVVYDENGKICCSISNVWDEFGSLITYPAVTYNVKRSIFEPLNEVIRKDNKKDLLISLFYELMQYDEKFKAYLQKVIQYWIKTEISNAETKIASREMLKEAIRETIDDEIIILEKFCPWRETIIDSFAKFVVYPSSRGGYDMHTVPASKKDSTARLKYPSMWCISLAEAKKDVPDITFCHKGNFLLTTKSIESCYKIAELSSKAYVKDNFTEDDLQLLKFIITNSNIEKDRFEEKLRIEVSNYDENMIDEICEKLSHVYLKNTMAKRKLFLAINLLKKFKDEKEFDKKQSMSLDEILGGRRENEEEEREF